MVVVYVVVLPGRVVTRVVPSNVVVMVCPGKMEVTTEVMVDAGNVTAGNVTGGNVRVDVMVEAGMIIVVGVPKMVVVMVDGAKVI
jgi:hypothetical protein